MTFGSSMSYVYGTYLMSPHVSGLNQNVNKNSFGRLINSYYGKHSLYKKTLPFVYNSGLLEFNDETKELQSSLEYLYEGSGDLYDEDHKEELSQALTAFVEDYNCFRHAFSETENEDFHKKGSLVDTITKSNEEALAAIGIGFGEDGTLTIREDGLTIDRVEQVKKLFSGDNSYAYHVMDKASVLGKEALSLLAPVPKFYGEGGSINYVVYAGTLFSACC